MPFSNETERVFNQPALVLHRRAYRNNSFILELFTRDYGRIALVAKGAASQKSRLKGVLQAFQPLSISWTRKTELGTLTSAESIIPPYTLLNESLYAAMYVNEIILKLITKDDPHPTIFDEYAGVLKKLSESENLEKTLRLFEKQFIQDLGYDIDFFNEAETHQPLNPNLLYEFIPGHGFIPAQNSSQAKIVFQGESIVQFGNNNLADNNTLKFAKIIMQQSLKQLLGDTELKTRELFRSYLSSKNL